MFWKAIAEGLPSEKAGVLAGVSPVDALLCRDFKSARRLAIAAVLLVRL